MTTVGYPESFQKHLKRLFKKFPKSKKRLSSEIENLAANPSQGDVYPGFGGMEVRKVRLALSEYNMGKRKGLRLIYVFIVLKDKVVPLAIYQKNQYAAEDEIRHMIIDRIKEIALEFEDR